MQRQSFSEQAPRWAKESKYVCTVEELKQHIELDPQDEARLRKVTQIHPMRITEYYLSLIDRRDKDDPIRKLVLPLAEELDASGSYDTSGERLNTKVPGLQHKYPQTALLLVTNECTTYCRFCFRKRFVGISSDEIVRDVGEALDYIRSHEEINNVLISGGDPLVLPTRQIEHILHGLSAIPHIRFIRIGTKVPVTFPDRILNDEALLAMLSGYSVKGRRVYIVTHVNHPREITERFVNAIDKLIRSNVIVNNQTVLLRDVNDDPDILADLHNRLVGTGINPYYVFQCRPVKRVKRHFQVPLHKGYEIVENAKRKLSGYGKRFKYVMSHRTGKIEIVGIIGDEIYLKYHQAKNPRNTGRLFKRKLNRTAAWLDELGHFSYPNLPEVRTDPLLEKYPKTSA